MTDGFQLVIPMAGSGSRFAEAGYSNPKPFIPVGDFAMYQIVCANLWSPDIARLIFCVQGQWNCKDLLMASTSRLGVEVTVVELKGLSAGPAATVLEAVEFLDPGLPIVIANSDQYVVGGAAKLYEHLHNPSLAGCLLTMFDTDPKWSYVRVDERDLVMELAEKRVISNVATVGIYGIRNLAILTTGLARMMESGDRTNGEFYVGPMFNHIRDLGPTLAINVGTVASDMFGLGIPSDLDLFLQSDVQFQAYRAANHLFGRH